MEYARDNLIGTRKSGWYSVIRLYLKIPVNFIHLILPDGFLFVHVLFGCLINF